MITILPTGGDTSAIQAALNSDLLVSFAAGSFAISDELVLSSGHQITMSGASIKQNALNKPIFSAASKAGIVLDLRGGTLIGEGSWSSLWTGNNGYLDQAVRLVGCQDIKVLHPTILNCAHSGIAIIGGDAIYIERPRIEGTHNHGVALPAQANFQNGIFIQDVLATGATSATIVHADISNVAQGILVETYPGVDCLYRSIQITDPFIHDIPGQHAFYLQSGNISIANPVMHDVELAGVKVQSSADNNQHIRNVMVTGASGVRVKSNLFEIASLGAGSISNANLTAVGDAVGVGIAVVGNVNDLKADLTLYNTAAHAVLIQGTGADDIDIRVFARNIGQHGAVISTTGAYNLRLRPIFRNPNISNLANQNGVVVATDTQALDIIDPDITDSAGRMCYGLYNNISMSAARIRGYTNIIGAFAGPKYGTFI